MGITRIIDTVLFDVGNTLLDFGDERRHLPAGLRLGYDHLRERGCALPSFERYARHLRRGLALRLIWSRLVTRRELRPVAAVQAGHRALGIELDASAAVEVANRYYAAMGVERRADSGARASLELLHQRGYRLGIVSNSFAPPGGLDRHLAEEGLLAFFPVRVYSWEVGYMKPDRRIFEAALMRLGASAHRTLYVGDKEKIDVKGAARLGMATVLKLQPGEPYPRRWKPDHVIRSLAELPAVLRAYPTDVHSTDAADGPGRL